MVRKLSLAASVVLLTAVSAWAEETSVRGTIDAVTVYRGQALVSRVIELPASPGLADIVVSDLPSQIQPASIFAEVEGDAEVRHIRPRMRAMLADVREEVRKFDEEIARIQALQDAEQAELDVVARHTQYLDKLEGFAAPTANVELTRGVLNAETLEKLSEFILAKRRQIAQQTLTSNAKIAELSAQRELLNRKKAEIAGGANRATREAVLMVDVKQPGAKVRLKYLVNNANWSPTYTFRAQTGQPGVKVQYQAIVTQQSGEDWGDVQMTLSTATPSVVARSPTLDPLAISLGQEPAAAQQQVATPELGRQLAARRAEAAKQMMSNRASTEHEAPRDRAGGSDARERFADVGRDNLFRLNKVAGELQQAELLLDKSVAVAARGEPTEMVSVTYTLPGTTSLPSRVDQQLVGIATTSMPGDFYKVATPVLTNYVYNEAQLTNDARQLLLAGPTMSYLDGEFVGSGELPTVAAGERFAVGFGVDSTLRATRELADKTESISGGNKIIQFQYAIRLENFGTDEAIVRVFDRIPVAANKDVKVALADSTPKVADLTESQRKTGIVRWDVAVKPQTQDGNATATVKYALTLEHDRNLNIVAAK